MTTTEQLSREQLTRDAATIAVRVTITCAQTGVGMAREQVVGLKRWASMERAVARSWGVTMGHIGREYVRQMRKA